MQKVLAKLCFGRAIGVHHSGEHITITDTGITVKGRTILNQQSFEADGKSLTDILQEYAKNNNVKNVPVCLGLKPEQMFFITSRTEYQEDSDVRDKLLDQAGFHSNEEKKTIVADHFRVNKTKSSSGPLRCIGLCQKQLASELHTAFAKAGVTDITLKPTPWVMAVHSLSKLPKKCKGWKVYIQVFLNETGGVATLMLEKHPVCWKRFASTPESVDKMISAIRSIFLQSTLTLSHPRVDGIVLFGANAEQLSQKLYDNLEIEVAVDTEHGFTDTYCSYCLAMAAMAKDRAQFDIFREVKPKPSIMKIFPFKMAAAVALMAAVMGLIMWQKTAELAKEYRMTKRKNAEYKWTQKKNTQEIAKDRKDLIDETEAVGKFLSTRMIWSDYLRDLPTRLPSNVGLSNLWAMCEYKETGSKNSGRKKKTRSLAMRGITLFEKGKAAPKEIEAFMESLRKVELLQKDFPDVKLAEVRWRQEGNSEIAMFTVQAAPIKKTRVGGDS